jgi:acyl-CoA reductase-like NAD-dependent aldehyde dehydrogenase
MIGSQVSKAQCDKILNYINIGKEEGAVVLVAKLVIMKATLLEDTIYNQQC